MKQFLRLLRKDLETSKFPMLFNSALVIIWIGFLRYQFESNWSIRVIVGLMTIPLTFLPLWLIWQTYQSLRSEWRDNTIYTLLLLPVPGWQINLSKLVALLIEFTTVMAVYIIATLSAFKVPIQYFIGDIFSTVPLSWFLRNGLILYVVAMAIFARFIAFVQLAYIAGKLVGKVRGLIVLWVLFLATWLTQWMGYLLKPFFRWLPALKVHQLLQFHALEPITHSSPEIIWDYSGNFGSWLTVIGLFILGSWLLQNYIETDD